MKNKELRKSVENHATAAWSNIEEADAISNVSHPSLEQSINAKDYVEENQK